jgi:hypothetical protein
MYHLPDESARKSRALEKVVRSTNASTGARKSRAQALEKVEHNQIDQLNQTKKDLAAAPPDPRVSLFIHWFHQEYIARQGRGYVFQGAKEGKLIKTMLAKLGDGGFEKLKAAATRMLSDDWGGPRASISLLSSQINQWLSETPRPKRGGKHIPAATTTSYDDVVQHFDTPAGEDKQP